MGKGLNFEAVNEDEDPDKLNDDRLDEEGDFFVSWIRSTELNHCVKFVLILVRIEANGNHSQDH